MTSHLLYPHISPPVIEICLRGRPIASGSNFDDYLRELLSSSCPDHEGNSSLNR